MLEKVTHGSYGGFGGGYEEISYSSQEEYYESENGFNNHHHHHHSGMKLPGKGFKGPCETIQNQQHHEMKIQSGHVGHHGGMGGPFGGRQGVGLGLGHHGGAGGLYDNINNNVTSCEYEASSYNEVVSGPAPPGRFGVGKVMNKFSSHNDQQCHLGGGYGAKSGWIGKSID